MIVVNAKIGASPETITALTPAVEELETKTRAESGCLDYAFSVEINDSEVIRITEKWKDMAALQAHIKAPHFAAFMEATAANAPKSVEMSFYEATEIPSPL